VFGLIALYLINLPDKLIIVGKYVYNYERFPIKVWSNIKLEMVFFVLVFFHF